MTTTSPKFSDLNHTIDNWTENPTDENARMYYEVWKSLEKVYLREPSEDRSSEFSNGAVAEWFFCDQPSDLWERVRSLGLDQG